MTRNLIFDETKTLSQSDLNKLYDISSSFEAAHPGIELGVMVIRTNKGKDSHAEGVRLYNLLGLGRESVNKGVLLIFAMDDRHVELIPGTGYNDLFTQAVSVGLLRESAVPLLLAGKPAEAIAAALSAVAAIAHEKECGVANPRLKKNRLLENVFSVFFVMVFLWQIGSCVRGIGTDIQDHSCPKCHSWMQVSRHAVREAAGAAEGTGIRERRCQKCGFNDSSSYSISSMSGDSSSWGSSGGSADGGGGGGTGW